MEGGGASALCNDLEQPALEEAPDLAGPVKRIRGTLAGEGAVLAALSGSGSTYFGLFADAARARRAEARLAADGFKVIRCRTLSLDGYRREWSRSLGSVSSRGRTR